MEKACEIYISNQYDEILKLSRIDFFSHKENILLHSSDGGTFFVSKFVFNFLSSLANPEADSILTPIPSTHLAPLCHLLNLKNDLQGDVTEFEEDFNLLGLDFRSCRNLASALNERNVKMIKRDLDNLEKDFEKKCKEIDEPEKETNLLDSTQLDGPEEGEVENYISAPEEISKEQFPLVAIDVNGQNFEDNENIEDANIIDKVPDNRNEGTTEIKRPKAKMNYMGCPKTTTKLVEGIQELESLECRICGQIYLRKGEGGRGQYNLLRRYNWHFRKHKVSKKKLDHMKSIYRTFLKCDQCNNTLKDKESLEKHKDNMHSLRICHICSYTTKAGSNALRYHVQTKHQVQFDENKPTTELKCTAEGCEKIFYRQYELNQHLSHVHANKECPICQKLFRNHHLKNHIFRVHHNKSKVCCEKCGKGFIYQNLLDQHEAVEHQGVRFQCRYPDCQFKDQKYRDKSNRAAHERNKHGAQYTKFLRDKLGC